MPKNSMNKRQYAYQVIKDRIVDGTYVPGQRIVIDQIAKEVGSSHIPIREAIHQLEADQLIEYKPNVGAIVRSIDNVLYTETLETLAILEGYATALSAPLVTEEGLAELERLNAEMRDALNNYELPLLNELNRTFHFTVYEFCPNKFLVENIHEAWGRLDIVRNANFTFFPNRTPLSMDEHTELIHLIRTQAHHLTIENHARNHKLSTLQAFKQRIQ